MKRKHIPYGLEFPFYIETCLCVKFYYLLKGSLLKEEQAHNDTISFKRSCRSCGKDRMHKNHLGKLASQSNFYAYCLHCTAM